MNGWARRNGFGTMCRIIATLLALAVSGSARAAAEKPTIAARIDATDLPRNLLRSEMDIRVEPRMLRDGRLLDLFYPIWVPGNHGPSGPVQNVVDLRAKDCKGNALRWDRDATQVEKITVDVPKGCEFITLSMTYIASQPGTLSKSSDTYGRPNFGGMNWNTVLWYPGGVAHQEISVAAELLVPDSWRVATSLGRAMSAGLSKFRFEQAPLPEYVDSPVIMGEFLQTVELKAGQDEPHYFHTVASEARFAKTPDWLVPKLEAMVREGIELMGSFPRDEYHFLIILDDNIGFGLEHGESTYIGMKQKTLVDAEREEDLLGGGGSMLVIPHEYFHAWCGKLAAPEGVVRDDFHTPSVTDMLWVYEGLTSYYDEVLGVRSGMTTIEEFRENVLGSIVAYQQRAGRMWRSVEDTARHARHLRDSSPSWSDLRRGQDYYGEGALFWLEADAIIRRGTNGHRSLDDFCREFFDVPLEPVGSQHGFERADVVQALRNVYPGEDWDALIRARIESPVESLEMGYLLDRIGYTIELAEEPTKLQKKREKDIKGANLRSSIGLSLDNDGTVVSIVPESPADRANIAYGMKVMAIDEWVYSKDRIKDAVKASKEVGRIRLTVAFGDRVEQRTIEYSGGARHPRLVHVDGQPDVLSAIAEPISGD